MKTLNRSGWLLFVIAIVFLACPTRASDNEEKERVFQTLLTADDPSVELALRTDLVARIHTLARIDLQKFDQKLDELLAYPSQSAPDLFEDPSYARLLAARYIHEQTHGELEYSYRRAIELGEHALANSVAYALESIESTRESLAPPDVASDKVAGEMNELASAIGRDLIRPKFQHPFSLDIPVIKKIVPNPGETGFLSGNEYKDGRFSLTFDDGPSRDYTAPILKNLHRFGLGAAFMWLAENAPRFPELIIAAKRGGMVLANHSFTHALLTKATPAQLTEEVISAEGVLQKAYGFVPSLYRCPYGACGPDGSNVRTLIANEGMVEVIWNIDSLDWQDHNPKSVYLRVKKEMELRKHGIILFHDIHPQSVTASRMVMADLRREINRGAARVLSVKTAIDELNSPGGMR